MSKHGGSGKMRSMRSMKGLNKGPSTHRTTGIVKGTRRGGKRK